MWFTELTGFSEKSPDQVRANLTLDSSTLTSRINGRQMQVGRLEIPTLSELRAAATACAAAPGALSVREVVADVQSLHQNPAHVNALFQVASQFNLLEMPSPDVTPEEGIEHYSGDPTQGPACAVACGAGTIYRNYFAPVNGHIGQTAGNQIDCLADVGVALGNTDNRLWEMRNGYALATAGGLRELATRLSTMSETERDAVRAQLRIGLQWDTEVTLNNFGRRVSQAYSSALPIAYSEHSSQLWRPFAQLVLEAAYEATLAAAVINRSLTGNDQVFLTLLGGGVFGNSREWIIAAIRRALNLYRDHGLQVRIVSYAQSKPDIVSLEQ